MIHPPQPPEMLELQVSTVPPPSLFQVNGRNAVLGAKVKHAGPGEGLDGAGMMGEPGELGVGLVKLEGVRNVSEVRPGGAGMPCLVWDMERLDGYGAVQWRVKKAARTQVWRDGGWRWGEPSRRRTEWEAEALDLAFLPKEGSETKNCGI